MIVVLQVVGRKYVRLYSPESSQNIYPYPEPMLCNSSQVLTVMLTSYHSCQSMHYSYLIRNWYVFSPFNLRHTGLKWTRKNTSNWCDLVVCFQVDVTNVDLVKFPNFEHLKFTDCILEEGQMLYIPPKWWHYVESLTPSFSVSFWWAT